MEAHTHNPEDKHIVSNGEVGSKRLFCKICAGPLIIVPTRLILQQINLR